MLRTAPAPLILILTLAVAWLAFNLLFPNAVQ